MHRPFNQLRYYNYEHKRHLAQAMASSSKAQGKRPMEPMQLVDEDSDYGKEDEPALATKASGRKKAAELTPEDYMELFRKQSFEGTRYPHTETMKELGIANDVEYLFGKCHLGKILYTPREGYQEETIQFLSSLELHILPRGLGVITFRVHDQDHTLPMTSINSMFGFPHGNGTKQDYDKDELDSLWATIGYDKIFNSSRSKSSHIRSPVLRYFHKSLANVFFARSNAGTIVNAEMELMDMGLKDLLCTAADGRELKGDSTNTSLSYVLVNQLMGYRQWVKTVHSKGATGAICVGGIVTEFLNACQVPLRSKPTDFQWVDIPYLKTARTLKKARVDGKFIYCFIRPTLQASEILLPCEHLTSFFDPGSASNIAFNPPDEFLHSTKARNVGTSAGSANLTDTPMEIQEDQPEYSFEGYAPEQYYFNEFSCGPRTGKAVTAAHERVNSLQQWNKAQDRHMEAKDRELQAQAKELKAQKKEIKSLKSRFKKWIKKMSCSSSAATLNTASTSPVHQAAYGTEEQADSEQEEQPEYVEEEQADYMQEDQPEVEQPDYETEVRIPYAPARHSSYQHSEREHVPIPARTSAYEPRERKRRSVKRRPKRQGSKHRQEGGPSSEHPPHNL